MTPTAALPSGFVLENLTPEVIPFRPPYRTMATDLACIAMGERTTLILVKEGYRRVTKHVYVRPGTPPDAYFYVPELYRHDQRVVEMLTSSISRYTHRVRLDYDGAQVAEAVVEQFLAELRLKRYRVDPYVYPANPKNQKID